MVDLAMRLNWKEICKFLAGAFFVSSGVLAYLYFANVSVPLPGASIVETPSISGIRSIVHAVFFVITLYIGYIKKS